jgi:RNA polymerase sigma-70 factor (ECF subfamily)
MMIDIAAVYKTYAPMVFRRCRHILGNEEDALDAMQDVFVSLLKAKQRLHGKGLSSLVYTAATNTCLNRLRQQKRRKDAPNDAGDIVLPIIDSNFDKVEARLLMEDILKNESELDRGICFMRYSDNMTLKEIGIAAGLSVSGVRKRLEAFNERARALHGRIF